MIAYIVLSVACVILFALWRESELRATDARLERAYAELDAVRGHVEQAIEATYDADGLERARQLARQVVPGSGD